MENLEENPKKTDEKLEKLDDEQLEQVAGGAPSRRYSFGTANQKNNSDIDVPITPNFPC